MDSWQSEEIVDGPNDHGNVVTDLKKIASFYNYQDDSSDSPNIAKDDFFENYIGEHADKGDGNVTKPTFKSILQAKKRLQAFSAAKQLKRNSSKDEKTEDLDKMLPKKSKKALYPLDKAQAVVQEIEEIKLREAKEAQQEQKKIDAIMAVAYKTLALKEAFRARSRSPSSEREQQFRKREIKSRNYRRSDSFKRRSVSPENYNKRVGKLVYPRNWYEYKEQGLTFAKDEELKTKMFPKVKHSPQELVTKILSLDGPSPLIEPFKTISLEEKAEIVPMSFLRITRSKPSLTYSVNNKKKRHSFVARKQLFQIISRDRRYHIEKLINSASSRSESQHATLTSRPWYAKTWRRSTDAECKILENSVGLSFLQTYSDEEEDNEVEEIVNINNIKENLTLQIEDMTTVPEGDERESRERRTLTPKLVILKRSRSQDKPEYSKKRQEDERSGEIKGETEETRELTSKHDDTKTGEIRKEQPEEVRKKDKDEMSATRKAIRQLEEELQRRKAIRMEEEKQAKKEKKKKKSNKKETTSESSEDEEQSSNRKKKSSANKTKYVAEDEESSSGNEKSKEHKSKRKYNKYKVAKVNDKSKSSTSSAKEHKRKRSEEENDDDDEINKKQTESVVTFEMTSTEGHDKAKKKTTDKNKQIIDVDGLVDCDIEKDKKQQLEGFDPFYNYGKPVSPILNSLEEADCILPLKIGDDGGRLGENTTEDIDKRERSDRKSYESDRRQNGSKKSRRDTETSSKADDSVTKRRDFEAYEDRKSDGKPRDEFEPKEEQKHKTEVEQEGRSSKDSERRSKCIELEVKSGKNRRSSEDTDKKNTLRERENSRERRHSLKIETKKENKYKLEPDWETLRSKRSRHRRRKSLSDSFPDEFEGFPLEGDMDFMKGIERDSGRSNHLGKREIGTPDTEEYRGNWEKDSYPIWESEDEAPVKAREKLNSSWESDEEIFERGHQYVENPRPLRNTLDLEIPLNIKPFKRRHIVDPDAELQLLKKQSLSLSEERRQLEIEKLRVKELEVKAESEFKESRNQKRRMGKDEAEEEGSIERRPDYGTKECVENEHVTSKKGRWDRKGSSPKISGTHLDIIDVTHIKKIVMDDEDSSTNVSSTTSANTATVLENEYEEFMKALTSSPRKLQTKSKVKRDEADSQGSYFGADKALAEGQNSVKLQVVDEIEEQILITPQPVPQVITILPKDIPLIPMPLPKEEVKPVPVPSPQIEIDKIPKPLININLSGSLMLDIAPKLVAPRLPSPRIEANALPVVIIQSPTIRDLGKPTSDKLEDLTELSLPPTDASLDTVKDKTYGDADRKLTNKPFSFTSMVLPSKRLLNNSNLNLGDSDDDEKHAKPLPKLEEFMNEDNTEPDGIIPSDKKKPELKVDKVSLELERPVEIEKEMTKPEKKEPTRSRTVPDKNSRRKRSPDRHARRDGSPRRFSHGKRESTPRRRGRESPRRRGHSPRRHSPRRRSPIKRRSPGKRRHSPRGVSPKSRRRSITPPRRKPSPKRSPTPKFRPSSPRKRSKSPDRHSSYKPSLERSVTKLNRPKSPTVTTSPLEVLKRSVADSTISDDLLAQPGMNMEEYTQSPVAQFYDRTVKPLESPKRESLDLRISEALGLMEDEPRPIPTTYSNYTYNQFPQQFNKITETNSKPAPTHSTFAKPVVQQQVKSSFVQVGNMVQILPTEDIPMIQPGKVPFCSPPPMRPAPKSEKTQIVQVGNMLQIVPGDLPPEPPPPPEPKLEPPQPAPVPSPPVAHEKQSAESTMRLKVAERRAERERRRLERERRRKEKDKRRKEKEKRRQIKLKQRTENMIKKALELEAESMEEEPDIAVTETPTQWPPLPALNSSGTSKEAGKGILVRANSRSGSPRVERKKVVQFADGVRPGEGTSPSGGEELSSPPPKKMPKEKRYKKTKVQKKNQKKKVKVKIIKKRAEQEESDEDDILPPPSPPPGSPPPHIYPPRMKPQLQAAINNVQPYLPNVVSIQTGHNHQQLFQSPQLNLIMHPHHPHHGPPPPPHHHGPPPPRPHHHPHHHHGPPLPPPPGPPHFHHGPPPPPPHHRPPPPPGPHHHHHGPPPPFHR